MLLVLRFLTGRLVAPLVLLALLRALSRGALIFGGASILTDGRKAGVVLLASAALSLVEGSLAGWFSLAIRRNVFTYVHRALLRRDSLLATPNDRLALGPVVFSGAFELTRLVADVSPTLAGDFVACLVASVVYADRLRALGGAWGPILAVLAVALLGLGAVRAARAEDGETSAFERVAEEMSTAVHASGELLASGRTSAAIQRFANHIDVWLRASLRSGLASGSVSRGWTVVVSAGAGAALLLGTKTTGASELAPIALAMAGLPPLLGIVRGLFAWAVDSRRARPVLDLLHLPEPQSGGKKVVLAPQSITFENVEFRYPGADRSALERASFRCERGASLALLGRNGSGKSTALRLLLGLAAPMGGTIRVDGVSLTELEAVTYRSQIAYLPQEPYCSDWMTVREFFGLLVDAEDKDLRRALSLVSLMSVLEVRNSKDPLGVPVSTLSGGQKQRLSLARVHVQNAHIVLLDEPDANLDAQAFEILEELIARWQETKIVLVATHSRELADRLGTSVVLGPD